MSVFCGHGDFWRGRWARRLRGRCRLGHRRSFSQFDSAVLVVDHQMRTTVSDRAGGRGLIIAIGDFQSVKVRFDFTATRASINLESRLVRKKDLNVTVA